MLKAKRKISSVLLIAILVCSMLLGASGSVSAADSNYSCSLASLWTNEAYEKPDTVNNKIGASFGMHFVDFLTVGSEIWGYYIAGGSRYGTIGVGLAKSTDGINFTNYGLVLDVGEVGSWDDGYASFPGIWYDNGTYYLVYEGAGTGCAGDIGLATSTDGVNFTRQGKILTHYTTGWETNNIGTPDLYKVGNTWYLTYHGYNGTSCQIGVASGTNIYSLTKNTSNPVLAAGPVGSSDYGTLGRRDVTYSNGYYYMVYEISTEANPSPGNYAKSKWSHAFARSTDMLNWTKCPQYPLIPQTRDGYGNDGPSWLTIDGVTYVYYRFCDESLAGPSWTRRARIANELNGGYNKAFEAESGIYHQVGRADGEGWSANTAQDSEGYLFYGPYVTDTPIGEAVAEFKAKIDNNTADNWAVMRLEVYDASTMTVLASRDVKRQEFKQANHYEFFTVPFYNKYLEHPLEFRVYYYDKAYLNVDRVLLNYGNFNIGWNANSLSHSIGRTYGEDVFAYAWCAETPVDDAGFLTYGPYESNFNLGTYQAQFTILVDNNTADNQNVVRVEVYDYDADQVLAQSIITRQQFSYPFRYQDFSLNFTINSSNAGHRLEFRTYWYDMSYTRIKGVTIR